MDPPKTWLLLVDHKFEALGDFFSVCTSGDIDELKKKVKEEMPEALSRARVDPPDLSVWKTKGANIIDESTLELLTEILGRIDVRDQDTIEKLGARKRVADLGLSDGQTLLVQLPEVLSVGPPAKRKCDDEYLGRFKSRKVAYMQPNELNSFSTYSMLQQDLKEKILDDRPGPDLDIPPLPLLYRGFGDFMDSTSLAGIQSGKFSSGRAFKTEVDLLVKDLCKIDSEQIKQEKTHPRLFKILFPGSDGVFETTLLDRSRRATDGHMCVVHGGSLVILEYKREMDTAEPQIAGYFMRLAEQAIRQICRGWRQPTLGLVIRGSHISFLGLAMIDTQVRLAHLTPTIPCTDRELESREPLYAAFGAARDLLKRIKEDSEEFVKSLVPEDEIPKLHRFPNIRSLRRSDNPDEKIDFQITARLGAAVEDRYLYIAEIGLKKIVVKFSRTYSKELHEFCALHNYAPQLLAFERLPGNWFGIGMEYFPSAIRIDQSPSLIQHGAGWLTKMDEIVEKIHENGFVHGDLRAPNFIADGERLFLVDFDWGGKEQEAKFPDAELLSILRDGRDDIFITRRHDEKVLILTKATIASKTM